MFGFSSSVEVRDRFSSVTKKLSAITVTKENLQAAKIMGEVQRIL